MKREIGQERDSKRTVEKRSPGSRPRIKKEETTGTTGRSNKVIRTGSAYPEEVVKARKRTGKSKSEAAKAESAKPRRVFKERTSDVFRRNVINKPVQKRFEETETDSLMTTKGKVLRGRLGKRNVIEGLDREKSCLLYTSPSPRDGLLSRMP